eukprot:TRINITY_DN44103_c0_g1_i1.p1 TRINITY_DN44103_c0_g1~~TRINITY_DN44103_c0_g1_i1.p1  ORF type:complete len:350 (-),score=37.09 TRINITY_DN44103_c0_g1_i1:70-1086(-)
MAAASEETEVAEVHGKAFAAAASTTAGELITTLVLYPVELVKSRLQASAQSFGGGGYEYNGLADGLITVLREEGLQGLFTGIRSVMVRSAATDFVAVYAGESLLWKYTDGTNGVQALVLRTLGCAVSVLLTLPLENIAARVTTSRATPSTASAMRAIWQAGGLGAFWRGLYVNLLLCFNPGLTFTAMAQLKTIILLWRRRLVAVGSNVSQLSWPEACAAGVAAKLCAMLLVYPLIRAKSLIQARDVGGAGILQVLSRVARHEGFRSLYQGLGAQLSKSLLSAALKYAVKERTEEIFHRMIRPAGTNRAPKTLPTGRMDIRQLPDEEEESRHTLSNHAM